MNDFTTHACEQVLRFTNVDVWDNLSEKQKVQLSFNVGAMSMSLNLSKEDSFTQLSNAREGINSMQTFREHMKNLIIRHNIETVEENINRPI